ncbi:hypothetical protein GCM10010156_68210 [Planobispora rosea]|uniref:Uncharacterized protein n=2 Tax=Planobispora rosea TaxID=35762 RepID=A0A8J3S8V6_PLARO|nr:hypothetical protein GCM10010156_68210 [Planobispora rosea]GIH88197.1 hypothetical protein Pro02_66050 [Planobispora rosea]
MRFTKAIQAGLQKEGFCFTWCRNGDLEEVARRFGAAPGTGVWADLEELEELECEHWEDLLQLTPAGEWTLASEPHGFQGNRTEVMEALSAGGCALNVLWRGERDSWVTYAVDGDIVTSFRLMDLSERSGSDPAALDGLLERVGLYDGLSAWERKVRIMALAEEVSGWTLTPEWVRSPQFAALITTPVPRALVPRAYLHPREPFLDEPEFARLLADPSPALAPAITRLAVSIVTTAVGLEEHPLAEETLRILELGEASPAEREALRARLHRAAEETGQTLSRQLGSTPDTAEAELLEQTSHALYTLGKALSPPPVHAAYAVADEAFRIPRLSRTDVMRLHVLRNVADRILSEEMPHP